MLLVHFTLLCNGSWNVLVFIPRESQFTDVFKSPLIDIETLFFSLTLYCNFDTKTVLMNPFLVRLTCDLLKERKKTLYSSSDFFSWRKGWKQFVDVVFLSTEIPSTCQEGKAINLSSNNRGRLKVVQMHCSICNVNLLDKKLMAFSF